MRQLKGGGHEWNRAGAKMTPRADYDAEDADDVAIYDAPKAELTAGGVVLPAQVSAAILRSRSSRRP